MKIVISGAAGFVGSKLVEKLALEQLAGTTLIELARRHYETPRELVVADITDSKALKKTLRAVRTQPSILIHCAAKVDSVGDYSQFAAVNMRGTQNLIAALKPTAIIYISTSSVYNGAELDRDTLTYKESSDINPNLLNNYAKSKFYGEQIATAAGLACLVVRPHIIYGPGDTTLLPKLASAEIFGRLFIPASGKAQVSITHIDNLTDYLRSVVENYLEDSKFSESTICNYADKNSISIEKLIRGASKILKLKDPIFLGDGIISPPRADSIAKLAYKFGRTSRLNSYIIKNLQERHILDLKRIENLSLQKYNFRDFVAANC